TFGFSARRLASDYGVPHVHAEHDDAEHDGARIDLEAMRVDLHGEWLGFERFPRVEMRLAVGDRKSTRLNSSHVKISYADFCVQKKTESRPDHRNLHRY